MSVPASQPLHRTPLYDFHVAAGARMIDFGGWEMPLLYRGINQEHVQTRTSGSIFDVSHMGRVRFAGKDAQRFLSKIATRKLGDQAVGQSRYSLICNEAGGILDDVIISRDRKDWLMVCNASNREKLLAYFTQMRAAGNFDLDIADQTESSVMVAIQGPKVIDRVAGVMPIDVKALKRYHFEAASFMMLLSFTVFRSGYTGEDGIEVILPAAGASMALKFLGSSLQKPGGTIQPAGLGARDTLRLEAGMPLYGHELTEDIDPISAGLGWAVDLKGDFIGAAALRVIGKKKLPRKLVGLVLNGRRIARQGCSILVGGRAVGEVTSGTFGPTVQKSIAMAYIDASSAEPGTQVAADISGSPVPATVVKLPFYKRPSN
jgi:aminomethyltransferase